MLPLRGARSRCALSREEYQLSPQQQQQQQRQQRTSKYPSTETNKRHESKRTNEKQKNPSMPIDKRSSGSPRPPRVIVIGAGISGLACARELSERRHDVLVLEARNRLGGRLRTVDLMMERTDDTANDNVEVEGSDLLRVRKWSPVDVGGAFIHGTGVTTTRTDNDSDDNIGSHDFGTNRGNKATQQQQPQTNVRKSSRLSSINYDAAQSRNSKEAAPPTTASSKNLNPIYVLASRKLRLPVQAAEGAFTCLVDHEGDLISGRIDEEVSKEFNEVLDLATKCCERGMLPVVGLNCESDTNKSSSLLEQSTNKTNVRSSDVGKDSPNYVSDDTALEQQDIPHVKWDKIDPDADFGAIFTKCREYYAARNKTTLHSSKEMDVRNYLFQWHVANLEMSSGAPMHELGQRWNDDGELSFHIIRPYLLFIMILVKY